MSVSAILSSRISLLSARIGNEFNSVRGELSSVEQKIPTVDALTALFIDVAHPIGSWYASDDPTDPSELFAGTTWMRLVGKRGLVACDDDTPVGSQMGSSSITLSEEQMPSHTHEQESMDTQGAHSHGRGTTNITGAVNNFPQQSPNQPVTASGAFTSARSGQVSYGSGSADDSSRRDSFSFDASKSWEGSSDEKGGHSHVVTLSNAGGGESIDIMNPYYATYLWKRIS